MAARASATVEIVAQLRDQVTGPARAVAAGLRSTFSGLAGSIGGLRGLAGAVVGGSFVVALKKLAEADVAVARFADTTRSTTEEISTLKFSLDQLGIGSNNLKEILNQLEGKRGDALRGPSQTRKAFARLGVDLNELRTLGGAQLLEELSAGFEGLGRTADAAAQLQAIFGDRFREFLPLLTQGRDGFSRLREEAEKAGAVISRQDTSESKEFLKQLNIFSTLAQDVFREIASTILPSINEGLRRLVELIQELRVSTPNPRVQQLVKDGFDPQAAAGFKALIDKDAKERRARAAAPQGNRVVVEAEAPSNFEKFFEGMRTEIAATREELNDLQKQGESFAKEFGSALSNNVVRVIREVRQGTLELKDALQSLLDGFIEDLIEIATKRLTDKLINAGLDLVFGGGGVTPQAGRSTAPGAFSTGGGGLIGSGNLGSGNKSLSGRFGGGGGGTVINLHGVATSEEQSRLVGVLMQHHLQRNRQVRVAAGVI